MSGFNINRYLQLVNAVVATQKRHTWAMEAHKKAGDDLNEAYASLNNAREVLRQETEEMTRDEIRIRLGAEDNEIR